MYCVAASLEEDKINPAKKKKRLGLVHGTTSMAIPSLCVLFFSDVKSPLHNVALPFNVTNNLLLMLSRHSVMC